MNLYRLAIRNLSGNAFRSWVVAICAFLVVSFVLASVMILRGAEKSLRLVNDRLGADIIVVPAGTQSKIETALLMGHPTSVWMPAKVLEQVSAVPGVAKASPQLYLSTLENAACCSVSNMFLIAYDPTTDFTIRPWLEKNLGHSLDLGEAVGGTYVFVPEGEQNIKLFGYFITLKGNMERTGSGLDQSMFLTFETAKDIARISRTMAEKPLEIPQDKISAVMVKVAPGFDPKAVAVEIMHQVPGITPIDSPDMFQSHRSQVNGLLKGVLILITVIIALSLLLIGLIVSMAANERKRELGVLRAIGATRSFVFQSLLVEAAILALAGGLAGVILTISITFLFRQLLINTLGLPFFLPDLGTLAMEIVGGLLLALVSVTLAALLPAYRTSRLEPAIAMRE